MAVNTPDRGDLAGRIVELSRQLLKQPTVDDVLRDVVRLAMQNVNGCEHAGAAVLENGKPVPRACSGAFAQRLDVAQCENTEGPCVDAMSVRDLVQCPDIAQETRWPRFRPVAADAGLGSVLSAPLVFDDEVVGSMNLYNERPNGFTAADPQFVMLFAFESAMAFGLARANERSLEHARQLEQALISRDVIGQAKGIIMERQRVTAEEAFDLLRRASQHRNVKLRDLAEQVTRTGEVPTA
jgi:GAF domain-containing protein